MKGSQMSEFINKGGLKFISSTLVSDYDIIPLTWKERLLSWPWRPWVGSKSVHKQKFYKMGDTVICSPQSFREIQGNGCLNE